MTAVEYRVIGRFQGYRFGSNGTYWTGWDTRGRLTGKWEHLGVGTKKKKGYIRIAIKIDGKRKHFLLHRLILEAFVGPCPEGMEGLHSDDNPFNNKISNLRWGTRQQNVNDAERNGKKVNAKGSSCARSVLTEKDIPLIRQLFSDGESASQIGKRFGVSKGTVQCVVHRRTWKHVA